MPTDIGCVVASSFFGRATRRPDRRERYPRDEAARRSPPPRGPSATKSDRNDILARLLARPTRAGPSVRRAREMARHVRLRAANGIVTAGCLSGSPNSIAKRNLAMNTPRSSNFVSRAVNHTMGCTGMSADGHSRPCRMSKEAAVGAGGIRRGGGQRGCDADVGVDGIGRFSCRLAAAGKRDGRGADILS